MISLGAYAMLTSIVRQPDERVAALPGMIGKGIDHGN
jgi:hypothetical protein